tara:strand:+ start:6749 stop:7222 length:474 start_codon:yes stop_codon:yes gene_type:complete
VNQIAKDVERYLPNQKKFAKDIEKYWRCKLVVDVRVTDGIQREDNYAPLDYMILKDTSQVHGYIELKNRDINHDKYDSLVLDHSKMFKIRMVSFFTGLPVFVGVRFLDKDMYYKHDMMDDDIKIFYGGRTVQYRNKYDKRQVEYIPMSKFKEFTIKE